MGVEPDFFQNLSTDPEAASLRYLVVGGHAVNAYGYNRLTLDADLMVPEGELEAWCGYWEKKGYRCIHRTDAFCQFAAPEGREMIPLDLVIVSESTFEKIAGSRQIRQIGETRVPLPDPLHIIALKLHALRNECRFREGRDLLDIVGLIRACDIEVDSPGFQNLLTQYGTERIRAEILRRLSAS